MKTILISLITLGISMWSGMSDMVAASLSKAFGVKVSVGEINLEAQKTTISKLAIANPPRYKRLSNALTAETMVINAPWTAFMGKDIVIDEIILDNVYIGFEFNSIKGTDGNWTSIFNNMQSAKNTAPNQPKQTLLIRRLVIKNINADVVFDDKNTVHHLSPTSQIVLTNISSQEGLSMDQLTNSELGKKLKSVFVKENANEMLKKFLQNPTSPIQQVVPGPFKGLF